MCSRWRASLKSDLFPRRLDETGRRRRNSGLVKASQLKIQNAAELKRLQDKLLRALSFVSKDNLLPGGNWHLGRFENCRIAVVCSHKQRDGEEELSGRVCSSDQVSANDRLCDCFCTSLLIVCVSVVNRLVVVKNTHRIWCEVMRRSF